MLISDLKFPEKLRYIHVLYDSNFEFYCQGILLPLITSMVYLFIFPYPSKLVYKFSLKRQQVLNELKNEIQQNELLTFEKSQEIRNQLAKFERQSDELVERKERAIEDRDKEIIQLREEITALKEKKLNPDTKYGMNKSAHGGSELSQSDQEYEISEKLIKEIIGIALGIKNIDTIKSRNEYFGVILKKLYEVGGKYDFDYLLGDFKDRTKANFYIDEMIEQNLVQADYERKEYSLSQKVKSILIDLF
ncbi:hypothetical protein [Enterovibrio norvegicus]|uniref:hypothetical protein n=1 Tax=Enterovibrio norvegicus TaxID=188144 RepID=UPI001E52C85A|nr:hypothetical protein [Enterovibrio norvegicus]MCC4796993.1 hypothetical protein [Enterovibrio norvegicus]